MGRLVAIDYGTKRVGIAVSDPLKMFAQGLTTVSSDKIFVFLKEYASKENIETFVVGWPKNLNNQPAQSMSFVEEFVRGLKKRFKEVPVELVDERFTSVMAEKAILAGGASKKQRQNKALVDEVSAAIILQSFMDSKNYGL